MGVWQKRDEGRELVKKYEKKRELCSRRALKRRGGLAIGHEVLNGNKDGAEEGFDIRVFYENHAVAMFFIGVAV